MNLAHLHLLLNHWPILGTMIGVALFFSSLIGKNDGLKQTSLAMFSLIALVAVPTYLSGNAAQDVIRREPGVSQALMATHEGAALLAFLSIEITGLVAWLGLWQIHRTGRAAGWTLSAVFVCSMVTVGLMAITGNTGGQIRHPEMLSETTWMVGTMGSRLFASIQYVVTGSSRMVWPVLETLHFLGLAMLLGAAGLLNLRVLGFWKQVPVESLFPLIPWGIAGLAINILTGFLFFLGMPFFYVYNIDFQLKILAVVLAGAILVLHCTGAFRDTERVGPGENAPAFAKFFAGSSLFLWIAVIFLGRYIPFFEDLRR